MLFVSLNVTVTPASVTAVSKSLLIGCFIGTSLAKPKHVKAAVNGSAQI
jgi:hypothetical protein